MTTSNYDPSFFLEKELHLQQLREEAQGESEQYQELVEVLTESYQHVLDLFRLFVDAYDKRSRRKAWKQFVRAARKLSDALKEATDLMTKEGDHEARTDAP